MPIKKQTPDKNHKDTKEPLNTPGPHVKEDRCFKSPTIWIPAFFSFPRIRFTCLSPIYRKTKIRGFPDPFLSQEKIPPCT